MMDSVHALYIRLDQIHYPHWTRCTARIGTDDITTAATGNMVRSTMFRSDDAVGGRAFECKTCDHHTHGSSRHVSSG